MKKKHYIIVTNGDYPFDFKIKAIWVAPDEDPEDVAADVALSTFYLLDEKNIKEAIEGFEHTLSRLKKIESEVNKSCEKNGNSHDPKQD